MKDAESLILSRLDTVAGSAEVVLRSAKHTYVLLHFDVFFSVTW